MNFYKHHIGDYTASTVHLSALEDCFYRRMLDAYYLREKPLPADESDVCRLVRAQSATERKAVRTVLGEFFDQREDGRHQKRCDEEVAQYQQQADTNRRIALEREAKRAGTNRATERTTNRDTKRATNRSPATNGEREPNHKPEPDYSEANASGAGAPPDPADVIFGLGVPLLTAHSVPERSARSMLGMFRKQHGDQRVIETLQRCVEEKPIEPVGWLQKALKANGATGPPRTGNAKHDETMRIMDEQRRGRDGSDSGTTIDGTAERIA